MNSSSVQEPLKELCRLLGYWTGSGKGSFPTIDPFEFREELKFERRGEEPLIHYEQRTLLKDKRPSHWESGFIRINVDGRIEISNSQDNGRVEVLTERKFEVRSDGFRLELESQSIQNDPRLVKTRRLFELTGDILRYSIYMVTNKVCSETPHIRAELRR